MSEHTGIAVVWPAWFEGSTDPELHVTALFLGNTEDTKLEPQDVLDAIEPFSFIVPGEVALIPGIEMFGRNKDVPVLRLHDLFNGHLRYARDQIDKFLWLWTGHSGSTEFGFNPHITLKNEKLSVMKNLPRTVHLEAPVLWWGSERPLHSKHRTVSV